MTKAKPWNRKASTTSFTASPSAHLAGSLDVISKNLGLLETSKPKVLRPSQAKKNPTVGSSYCAEHNAKTATPDDKLYRQHKREADIALVNALLKNDEATWKIFYPNFRRQVQEIAQNVFHVEPQDMDDVVSEIVTRLMADNARKLRLFNPERGNLRTFLHRVSTNFLIDRLRSQQRKPKMRSTENLKIASDVDTSEYATEMLLHNSLQRELAQLPAPDRKLVECLAEGLSMQDIARRLKIELQAAYSRKHKIIGRLREAFVATEEFATVLSN